MSSEPDRPRTLSGRFQDRSDAFMDKLGITQEIILEDGGYVWAFYHDGKRLPRGIYDVSTVIRSVSRPTPPAN